VPLDTRRAAGCPVRRRWAGGMGADGSRKVGKMCALSALGRRPAARGSRWVARGGAGAGPAEVWGEPFWPANAGIAAGRGGGVGRI